MGIHDSNASLLPYLIQEKEPFTLNSTGTVVVAMHPTDEISISPDDLGKVVYYNLSAFGRPVRTTIFLGGLEFDTYAGLLAGIHGEGFPGFDRGICERMLMEKKIFLLPSLIPFGMFPNSPARAVEDGRDYPFGEIAGGRRPAFFMNKEEAYATLNISLAIQTAVALQKAGHRKGARIFVEGGFRKNDTYTAVLASLFPESEVAVTNLEEATAFGAALLARSALDGTEPGALKELFTIERRTVKNPSLKGLDEYAKAFIEMAGR
jgi:sugar (pentulose or hexulose) kinase